MTPREEHVNKIKKIQETMREVVKNSPHYKDLQRQLNTAKAQLRVFDELNGKKHKFKFALRSKNDKNKFIVRVSYDLPIKTLYTTKKRSMALKFNDYEEAKKFLEDNIIFGYYVGRIKEEEKQ